MSGVLISMKNTKKIGDSAEEIAAKYLKENGLKIKERNFRTRFGEVDIIATEKDTIVFVEVKAKTAQGFGDPGEMITPKKIEKIKRTANSYLYENQLLDVSWRIDALLIRGKEIEHIRSIT